MEGVMGGPNHPAARDDVSLIRPFLLTSGRSEPVDTSLPIEAQVVAGYPTTTPDLAFECRAIVDLCREARSVAEIAALLGMHIGVARVLVADLAESGYVVVRRPDPEPARDITIVERVIRGLERIR
jgi:hypothetical protein